MPFSGKRFRRVRPIWRRFVYCRLLARFSGNNEGSGNFPAGRRISGILRHGINFFFPRGVPLQFRRRAGHICGTFLASGEICGLRKSRRKFLAAAMLCTASYALLQGARSLCPAIAPPAISHKHRLATLQEGEKRLRYFSNSFLPISLWQ